VVRERTHEATRHAEHLRSVVDGAVQGARDSRSSEVRLHLPACVCPVVASIDLSTSLIISLMSFSNLSHSTAQKSSDGEMRARVELAARVKARAPQVGGSSSGELRSSSGRAWAPGGTSC
jgi:hypothetical protein